MNHGGAHAVLHVLEGRCGALPPLVHLDDVPTELRLERLCDLSRLQLESRLLELRYHLPTRKEAKFAALILRAWVLGVFFREGGKIGPVQDFLEQVARLVLALDQNVPRAHLLLGLESANLLVVIFFGFRIADGFLDAFVEVDVAQCSSAPILHTLVKTAAGAELLFLSGIRKELVLNEEFQEDAPLRSVRQAAEVAADFGLGEPHVSFRDGLTVDPGYHGLLGPNRQAPERHEREDASCRPAVCHSHVMVLEFCRVFLGSKYADA